MLQKYEKDIVAMKGIDLDTAIMADFKFSKHRIS
jgi:hypothetical protein